MNMLTIITGKEKNGSRIYQKLRADCGSALELFEKAARRGHAQARFNCGWMYLKGIGTEADRDKAKMWLSEAAAQSKDKVSQDNAEKLLRIDL